MAGRKFCKRPQVPSPKGGRLGGGVLGKAMQEPDSSRSRLCGEGHVGSCMGQGFIDGLENVII